MSGAEMRWLGTLLFFATAIGGQVPLTAGTGFQDREESNKMPVDAQRAMKIAQKDAETQYKELVLYDVSAVLNNDVWNIDYYLKDKKAQGGGPHYLISRTTGEILSKKYEQ